MDEKIQSDSQNTNPGQTSSRLVSLDALRGFDMFWIVGAEEIVHSLHKISSAGPINFLATQLSHRAWEGVNFYDLIFPLFVFIVGVSLVYSLNKTIAAAGREVAIRRVISRSVFLYLIGIFYYGGFNAGIEDIRLLGVLQRIALCYLFSGLMFCTLRLRGLIIACALLLIGYWAVMSFVPVPGVGAGDFAEGKNLANYIDKLYLPLFKWNGDHDPEGLLSTLPAIANCLLGVFAGLLLMNKSVSPQKKVFWLLGSGVVGILLGTLWGMQFPIIKNIWTSSFVLVACGYSCLFLAVFYQVIDIWGYKTWAQPFVWIGLNPITIYLAHNLVDFQMIANRLVGGPIKASFGRYDELLITLVVTAFSFLLVRFLYRKRIFLRV